MAESSSTLQKSLEILRLIGAAERSGGAAPTGARLAQLLAVDPAQVSRMLKELQRLDLIERDDADRGFRLAGRSFALARAADPGDLLADAQPVLRRLVVELGLPAWVSVLVGPSAVTVAAEAPPWTRYVACEVGKEVPAWCSGPGRALLLPLADDAIETLFGGVEFVGGGPNGPRSLDELMRRVESDRLRGTVVADGEFEFDAVEVARPVGSAAGRTIAALSVAAPARAFEDRRDEIVAAVESAADALRARAAQASGSV